MNTPISTRIFAGAGCPVTGITSDTGSAAAVEGEIFTAEVLARVLDTDTQTIVSSLSGDLDRRHHLVRAQGVAQVNDHRLSRYRFRHILFQKYLYGSLDAVQRSHLHTYVGAALKAIYTIDTGLSSTIIPQLARHAEQAGALDQAVTYYQQAGNWALQVFANEEAYDNFVHALAWMRGIQTVRSEHQAALDSAKAYYSQSQQSVDPLDQSLGHYEMCVAMMFVGEFAQGLYHCRQVLARYDLETHRPLIYRFGQDPATVAQLWAVYNLWYLGYPDQALEMAEKSLRHGVKLDHRFSLFFAECFKGRLHRWRREVDGVTEFADRQLEAFEHHDISMGYAGAMLDHAWVLAEKGCLEQAIEQYKDGLNAWLSAGMANHLSEFWSMLAQMCAKAGRIGEALKYLEDALVRVEETEERYHEAEIFRLRGEIRLMQGPDHAAAVEADFVRAIAIAKAQQAKMLELRATMSLCRLWLAQDYDERKNDAFEALVGVYNWFSEGFGTQDLQEAKALLDTLS